jgi:antibiotic biosynthesis monooxygenase (ABM) superfamily enzyme
MHHDGHVFAADEPDHDHHRPTGVASVHTRALVTWVAIYPLAAIGMYVMATFAPAWPVPVRALVLTAVVVPVTVYLTVPRLLLVVLAVSSRARRKRPVATDAHRAAEDLSATGATP